jgi:hypothetical protein
MPCAFMERLVRDSADWHPCNDDSDGPKSGTNQPRPLSDRHPFDDAELRRRVDGDDPR